MTTSTPTGVLRRAAVRRHVITWGTTAVLLAATWGLNAVMLGENAAQTGIVITGQPGTPVQTRNLVVTVEDVRAAHTVTDAQDWSADGTWLVVDLSASAVDTQVAARLGLAELVIGERTFRATERGQTFAEAGLVPGVARSGSVAFELPSDAIAGPAMLRFSPVAYPNLDGVIEIAIDLDAVRTEDSITLRTTDWTDPVEAP